MDDGEHRNLATAILTGIGLRVDKVPRSNSTTADLVAHDENSTYFIELKRRFDFLTSEDAVTLNSGAVSYRSDSAAYDNQISKRLRKGRRQLDASAGSSDGFRVIWIHADGIDQALRVRQAFSTFYGRVYLLPVEPLGDVIECYYFDYSEAWSMRSIDALILTSDKGLQLCLNEFSERRQAFRESSLCCRLEQGVVDPATMERKGQILACRNELPRKSHDELLRALQARTGIRYELVPRTQHSASVLIMKFDTVNEAFQWLISQQKAESVIDCWCDFCEWAEKRHFADLSGPNAATAKGTLARVVEICDKLAESPEAKRTTLAGDLESIASAESRPELVAAATTWAAWLVDENKSVPKYEF